MEVSEHLTYDICMYMSYKLYKTYCVENLSKNTAELHRNNKNDISSLASFFLLPACSSDRIDLRFSFDRIKQGLESHFSYLEEDTRKSSMETRWNAK